MTRVINDKEVFNNRTYRIKLKEKVCSCTFCAFGRGDNQTGHLSRWGKKVAKRREYTLGKSVMIKSSEDLASLEGIGYVVIMMPISTLTLKENLNERK